VNGVPIQLPKPTIRLTVARPDPYPRRVTGLFFASKVLDPAAIEKEAVRADLEVLAPGWRDRTRLYEEASKLPSAPDLGLVSAWSVLSALNGGVNAVSASGHGDPGGCCGFSDPPTRPAGLVYADSCLTNAFDRNGLGARWTRDAAGAVAYIGNSRYSWIGRGAVLERAFWADAVRGQIGWANDGRSWLVSDWFLRWTNFSLNLMGDPEMQLWAGTPRWGRCSPDDDHPGRPGAHPGERRARGAARRGPGGDRGPARATRRPVDERGRRRGPAGPGRRGEHPHGDAQRAGRRPRPGAGRGAAAGRLRRPGPAGGGPAALISRTRAS